VRVAPLLDRVGRFCDLIDCAGDSAAFAALRAAETMVHHEASIAALG
jgi:hypothetical protein